jgi:hypothetical protein
MNKTLSPISAHVCVFFYCIHFSLFYLLRIASLLSIKLISQYALKELLDEIFQRAGSLLNNMAHHLVTVSVHQSKNRLTVRRRHFKLSVMSVRNYKHSLIDFVCVDTSLRLRNKLILSRITDCPLKS